MFILRVKPEPITGQQYAGITLSGFWIADYWYRHRVETQCVATRKHNRDFRAKRARSDSIGLVQSQITPRRLYARTDAPIAVNRRGGYHLEVGPRAWCGRSRLHMNTHYRFKTVLLMKPHRIFSGECHWFPAAFIRHKTVNLSVATEHKRIAAHLAGGCNGSIYQIGFYVSEHSLAAFHYGNIHRFETPVGENTEIHVIAPYGILPHLHLRSVVTEILGCHIFQPRIKQHGRRIFRVAVAGESFHRGCKCWAIHLAFAPAVVVYAVACRKILFIVKHPHPAVFVVPHHRPHMWGAVVRRHKYSVNRHRHTHGTHCIKCTVAVLTAIAYWSLKQVKCWAVWRWQPVIVGTRPYLLNDYTRCVYRIGAKSKRVFKPGEPVAVRLAPAGQRLVAYAVGKQRLTHKIQRQTTVPLPVRHRL